MANIRTARRSGFVTRGGRSVRETLWGDVTSTITVVGAGNAAVLLNVTGAGLLALRPLTIIRARGVMHLQSDQTAATESQACAVGMAIVSDQSVAIGATAIPSPVTDAGSDAWFMFQEIMASQLSGAIDSRRGEFLQYDSRAMRKMEDGFQLVVMFESEAAALTSGVSLRHQARILIKLH